MNHSAIMPLFCEDCRKRGIQREGFRMVTEKCPCGCKGNSGTFCEDCGKYSYGWRKVEPAPGQ